MPAADPRLHHIETHRSVVRRAAASLLDAWDARDVQRLERCCSADGLASVNEAFAETQWSLHLLSNEAITVDLGSEVEADPDALPVRATGSWLVFAMAIECDGRVSTWRGGDLRLDFEVVAGRATVADARYSPRLHVGVAGGWLFDPLAGVGQVDADDARESTVVVPELAIVFGDPVAPASYTVEQLVAEADVQALVASAVHQLGRHDDPSASTRLRFLANPNVVVAPSARAARGVWRELVIDTVDGASIWKVNQLIATAERVADVWHLASLDRIPLIDGPDGVDGLAWHDAAVVAPEPERVDVAPLPSVAASPAVLDVLAAIDPIRAVHTEYMAACDAHAPDRVAPLFVPDARWETVDGSEVLNGVDEIHTTYQRDCTRLTFCIHFLGNEQIVVAPDGTSARAAWTYFEPATNRGDLAVWTAGRYELDLVRTDEGWRYRHFRIEPRLAARYGEGWTPNPLVPLP